MDKDTLIHFNIPPNVGTELSYMREAMENHKICGDGSFTKRCSKWMQESFNIQKVLLTTSGTSALEMAAFLCDIEPGDEVILPSFTFTSTATAFVLVGAKLVYVDIRPDTMNIDESLIENAITDKTKVICVMHYAGVACEMDAIMAIAKKHGLKVVEDAAQGIMSTYRGRPLGTIGDFGVFSFHETKNFSMGEGGALLIKNEIYNVKAEILREKGTNRSQFFRGEIDKYSWMDYGSSYLPSDILAAHLWAQLEKADEITKDRMKTWNIYRNFFEPYEKDGLIQRQSIPKECNHNAHMFYIKFANFEIRQNFIMHMKNNGILSVFHYVPLHASPAGKHFGRFHGEDLYTTAESDKLVRLPLYYNLEDKDMEKVLHAIRKFMDSLEVRIVQGRKSE